MKQTVNRILLTGLTHATNPPKPKRFVVKPIQGMRLPSEWTSGSVQELIDIVEGSNAR
ncbi:hypothetical protein [Granulicella sp. S156]|uniref:hypothetical protein n=1 Tax=Granulicella sp. S156 TaxID=1747224 RepID=UPI00131EBB6A|nr:hypothetical protein [Granulicella sp. S156]